MRADDDLRLFLAKAHRAGDLRAAAHARSLRAARAESRAVRVRIGRRIIRLGERLAAEPANGRPDPASGSGRRSRLETLP